MVIYVYAVRMIHCRNLGALGIFIKGVNGIAIAPSVYERLVACAYEQASSLPSKPWAINHEDEGITKHEHIKSISPLFSHFGRACGYVHFNPSDGFLLHKQGFCQSTEK